MKIATVILLAMLVTACASTPPVERNVQGTIDTVESFCTMTNSQPDEQSQCVLRLTEISAQVYSASQEIVSHNDATRPHHVQRSAKSGVAVDSANE